MPSNHYQCQVCSTLCVVVYRVADVGSEGWPPRCETCEEPMDLAPQPGDFTIDAKEPFQKFDVWRDVYEKNPKTGDVERHQRLESVDSLHTMRKIEADSEKRFRNGEGEPMRFRALSQNKSNLDQGSFGTEGQIGTQPYNSGMAPMKKSGRVQVKRHGTARPVAPVARGAGHSPLGKA